MISWSFYNTRKNYYSSHAIETVSLIIWRALNEFKLEFILSFCDIFEYLGFQAIVSSFPWIKCARFKFINVVNDSI